MVRSAPVTVRIKFVNIALHLFAVFTKTVGVAVDSGLIGIQAITASRAAQSFSASAGLPAARRNIPPKAVLRATLMTLRCKVM